MRTPTSRLAFILFLPFILLLSHCQKKEEPPPPKVSEAPSPVPQPTALPESGAKALAPAQGEGSTDCCEVVANPNLQGRMGQLIIHFPEGGKAGDTRVDVFHPVEQKALAGGYGNQTVTLMPGIYDVDISKKRLASSRRVSGFEFDVSS